LQIYKLDVNCKKIQPWFVGCFTYPFTNLMSIINLEVCPCMYIVNLVISQLLINLVVFILLILLLIFLSLSCLYYVNLDTVIIFIIQYAIIKACVVDIILVNGIPHTWITIVVFQSRIQQYDIKSSKHCYKFIENAIFFPNFSEFCCLALVKNVPCLWLTI
jgi:hypothetical protein